MPRNPSNFESWARRECRFAQDNQYALWHSPKFEQAMSMVDSNNSIDKFGTLANLIKKLVDKMSETQLPTNREYPKIMAAVSSLEQIRRVIGNVVTQGRRTTEQGQDTSKFVKYLQGQASQVAPIVDQILQSIQAIGKRLDSKPMPGIPVGQKPRGRQRSVAQKFVPDPAAPMQPPAPDPDDWSYNKPIPPAAPAPKPVIPDRLKPPAVKPKTKPEPIAPKDPQLYMDQVGAPEYVYNEFIPFLQDVKAAAADATQITHLDFGDTRDHMMELFQKGQSGLNWYDNIRDILDKRLGPENTQMFLKFVAATSPRMPVMRNLEQAIKAYNQYMSGQEFSGFMRTHVPNILRTHKGEELSGDKVSNFAKAMGGDPNAVTLDVWMARAFGMNGQNFSEKQYNVLSDAVRELAAEAGVEPRQFQAAVWTGIKNESGSTGRGLSAEPIDKMLDPLWGKFNDAFLKYKGEMTPKPEDFRLQSWIARNCKFAQVPAPQPPLQEPMGIEEMMAFIRAQEPEANVTYHAPHGNSAGGYVVHAWGRELSGYRRTQEEAIRDAKDRMEKS